MKIHILMTILFLSVYRAVDNKCNVGLLESYGLEGRKEVSNETMKVCPGIKYSCCNLEDESKIFSYYE